MNQRMTPILGIVLLLVGCVASSNLALAVFEAQLRGIFDSIANDRPTNPFEDLQCPVVVRENETSSVRLTIANPISESLVYTFRVQAPGFSIDTPYIGEVPLAGHQAVALSWVITARNSGNRVVIIEALSDRDSRAWRQYRHGWPTSFRGACGILVIRGPLTGAQALLLGSTGAVVGVGMTFVGAGMTFVWLRARMRKRAGKGN